MRYPYSCEVSLLLTFHLENVSQGRVAESQELHHSMANINLHQCKKTVFFALAHFVPATIYYMISRNFATLKIYDKVNVNIYKSRS